MDHQKQFAKIFGSENHGQILAYLDYEQSPAMIKIKWVSGSKCCTMALKEPEGESIVGIFNKMDKEFSESLIDEMNNNHPE